MAYKLDQPKSSLLIRVLHVGLHICLVCLDSLLCLEDLSIHSFSVSVFPVYDVASTCKLLLLLCALGIVLWLLLHSALISPSPNTGNLLLIVVALLCGLFIIVLCFTTFHFPRFSTTFPLYNTLAFPSCNL